uniref:Uncharacterized protein n=1 Tax=Kalanchoe fedtschenkoi TaxID=63787 RepID=A0A7N0V606_KALFE
MEKSEEPKLRSCLGCQKLRKLLPSFTTTLRRKAGNKEVSIRKKNQLKEESITLGGASRCDYSINDVVPSIKAIHRLSGSGDSGGAAGGFKYDPVSYAHNFDDGNGDDDYDDDNVGRRFSSRYAVATPPSAYSSKSPGNEMG